MGSDQAKIEKKKLKAQVKAEKARAKAGISTAPASVPEKIKWYKDPNWVRAIIAIASLIVMIITLYLTLA